MLKECTAFVLMITFAIIALYNLETCTTIGVVALIASHELYKTLTNKG